MIHPPKDISHVRVGIILHTSSQQQFLLAGSACTFPSGWLCGTSAGKPNHKTIIYTFVNYTQQWYIYQAP